MNLKASKSQEEVWEWKKRLYDEIKDLPKNERLKYIQNKTKEIVQAIRDKKDQKV